MKRLKSIIAVALVVMSAVISAIAPALPANAVSSSSLSIDPRKNYQIEPGKSQNDTLNITNMDSVNDLQLSLRVIDFSFTDNTGTPKLFLDPNAPQTTWSLKPYMTVPESVTIPAGSSKSIKIRVSIPKNVGAGSYYSAIIYSAGSGSGLNVGLSASGVTLVFVSVPGKVNENLALKQLGVFDLSSAVANGGEYKFTSTKQPVNIGYTLKNEGNVTESPAGTITMKYMFGKKIAINDINPVGSLALIGQTRTFTSCIKLKEQSADFQGSSTHTQTCDNPGLWPGYYSISFDGFYGQNGNQTKEVTGSGGFWYLPWWFVITFLVIVLIIAFFVWRLVHKLRKSLRRGGTRKSLYRK